MELDAYLAVIASEAARMVAAADEAGLDAATPTCPTWDIRKLILHTGEVHRWATAVVEGEYTSLAKVPNETRGPLPTDDTTLEWFRDGVVALIHALATADDRALGPQGRMHRNRPGERHLHGAMEPAAERGNERHGRLQPA